ncbi:hypothetical protein A1O3_09943 [Capronia epimyces CBS 606.96]|uniref:Uncharacterized protein n=1 Tax=Capronia epimyces CBS 606.96 TaxID=1182542 RepID=W9Y5I1_9EURO|nr:uncharacterized protein A1O3_09943 [Capronia epimyces CBS 606.96]EXJ77714.1 hypothetical protein A1O3_09943 [Capronia epimyces CBS 606.96]
MLRLGDAVRSKLKGPPLRRHSEKALRLGRSEGADEGSILAVENSVARRRTEALNLYKGKIKGLTGNGHIRRKPVNGSKAPGIHQDAPLLSGLTDPLMAESAEQSDNDSAFGSLTRSFASAVDKLDFSSSLPYNVPFLRSRSSFFSAKKDKDKDGGEREEKRQVSGASSAMRSPSASLPSSSPPAPPSDRAPAPAPAPPDQTAPDHHASQSAPSTGLVFASEKNPYVLPEAPDGHLIHGNPLRMHPPFGMATTPSHSLRANQRINDHQSASPTPRIEIPRRESEDDDDDSLSLEDAPIYSPSLGDLSQYARDTPASKATYRSEPQGSRVVDAVSISTPTPTPTRNTPTGRQQRGVLKKSKSGMGMFSRSKSGRILTMTKSKGAGSDSPNATAPSTPSPLDQREINRNDSTGKDKTVKKSRSLHFGGLFKRPSEPDLAAPIPRDLSVPFQPATPSPLRTVTRARGNDGKLQSHVQGRRSSSGL